jgi:hypothetical protein
MSWTLALAGCAAVTGLIGSLAAIRNRVDAIWRRRSRALPLRSALIALRENFAEAKATPGRVESLTSTLTFRAHIQALDQARPGCPDRRLCRLLAEVSSRSLKVASLAPEDPDGPISYALIDAVDQALTAINQALDRLDRIERNAPG